MEPLDLTASFKFSTTTEWCGWKTEGNIFQHSFHNISVWKNYLDVFTVRYNNTYADHDYVNVMWSCERDRWRWEGFFEECGESCWQVHYLDSRTLGKLNNPSWIVICFLYPKRLNQWCKANQKTGFYLFFNEPEPHLLSHNKRFYLFYIQIFFYQKMWIYNQVYKHLGWIIPISGKYFWQQLYYNCFKTNFQ